MEVVQCFKCLIKFPRCKLSEAGGMFGQNYCSVSALLVQPVQGAHTGSLLGRMQGRAVHRLLNCPLQIFKFHTELQCSLSVQTEFFQVVFPVCGFSAADLLPFSSVCAESHQ